MSRLVIPLFAALAVLLTAKAPAAQDIMPQDALRKAAYAGEVETVEAAFKTAHDAFLDGKIEADDLRRLNVVLTVSHPKMAALTESWLRAYPNSPYANTVQAWLYHDIAWAHRGPYYVSNTHPQALQSFQHYHRKALRHAEIARSLAPRYIPASDAIIVFGNGAGSRQTSWQTFDEVMTQDPNIGTLRRALSLTHPGWGGTVKQARHMCKTYAPRIEAEAEGDPLDWCLLFVWQHFYPEEQNDWAYELLHLNESPELARFRVYGITQIWGWSGIEDAEFTHDYLSREGVIWTKAAEVYDTNIPHKYDLPFLYEKHLRLARAHDLERLEEDPYNPDVLTALLEEPIPGLHFDGYGSPLVLPKKANDRETKLELARRLLVAAPYSGQNWWRMSSLLQDGIAPQDMLSVDPYLINSVVYSNHNVWELMRLMHIKKQQYETAQGTVFGRVEGDGYSVTEDVDNDIICPLIRARRMFEAVCVATQGEHSSSCEHSGPYKTELDAIQADAVARDICARERTLPIPELVYSPLQIDLMDQSGG